MKKILMLLAFFALIQSNGQVHAQSPHETVTFSNGNVTYGRPYMKNRVIFGDLVPFDEVWRLGADQATTITFNSPAKFSGKEIPKGTYTMFAIPGEKEWTLILNTQLNQWGAFKYEEHKDKDIASVRIPVTKLENPVDQFTIHFNNPGYMVMEWERTRVAVPVSW